MNTKVHIVLWILTTEHSNFNPVHFIVRSKETAWVRSLFLIRKVWNKFFENQAFFSPRPTFRLQHQ